jgi:hypothetical protein
MRASTFNSMEELITLVSDIKEDKDKEKRTEGEQTTKSPLTSSTPFDHLYDAK